MLGISFSPHNITTSNFGLKSKENNENDMTSAVSAHVCNCSQLLATRSLVLSLGIVFMGSSLEFAVIPRGQGLPYSGGPGLCLVGEWQCGTRQSLIILEGAHNLPSRAVQSSEARPTTTNSYTTIR